MSRGKKKATFQTTVIFSLFFPSSVISQNFATECQNFAKQKFRNCEIKVGIIIIKKVEI